MAEIGIYDVLATSYGEIVTPPIPTLQDSAVLFIDIQQLAGPDYLQEKAEAAGLPAGDVKNALADYRVRFEGAVANCKAVLETARRVGFAPIHVKIQSSCGNARDTGPLHRSMGWTFAPGDKTTEFLPETAPNEGEIVITKTASGAFSGTGLDSTLRNMGIKHLFMCGFVTDECVETTARVALDLGYRVKIVQDATTTYDNNNYLHVIQKFSGFGMTQTAAECIGLLKTLS